jgi:hypothetical protein
MVEELLERHAAADAAGKARVELLLVRAAAPDRARWLLLIVFGGVGVLLAYGLISDARYESAVRAGRPAIARVARLDEGFCVLGSKSTDCVELELEVFEGASGPRPAKLTYSLPRRFSARVQPGSWLRVSVDAEEPEVVRLDEAALREPAPAPARGF